jgi:tetratricopeptide (TPR) repeat protein
MEKILTASEYQRKGFIHLLKEEYEPAIRDLTCAAELKPTYPDIHNALGIAHYFGGSREMAIEHFKRAVEINPEYLEARLHLAYTLLDRKNFAEGVFLLNEFNDLKTGEKTKIDSTSVMMCNIHSSLGEMYEKKGELLEAQNEYRKALKQQPDFLDVRLKLARTFAKLELFEESHREFDRILKSNNEYLEAHMELGMLYRKEGKYEEARKQWEACLKSEPHSLKAKLYLRRLIKGEFKEPCEYDVTGQS